MTLLVVWADWVKKRQMRSNVEGLRTTTERKRQMNIFIPQGSPRANGNTVWMAEVYRKAAFRSINI